MAAEKSADDVVGGTSFGYGDSVTVIMMFRDACRKRNHLARSRIHPECWTRRRVRLPRMSAAKPAPLSGGDPAFAETKMSIIAGNTTTFVDTMSMMFPVATAFKDIC